MQNSIDVSLPNAIITDDPNLGIPYAIAIELRRRHKDADIEKVTLRQIYNWTLELSEFEDDAALANDDILYAIYQDWYEEHIHGRK